MIFNLNDSIILVVNEDGKKLLLKHWEGICQELSQVPGYSDGKLKVSVWEFATIFGSELHMGMNPPVETQVELLRECALPAQPDKTEKEIPEELTSTVNSDSPDLGKESKSGN